VLFAAFFLLHGDADRVLALEVAAKELFAERVFDVLLDRTTQRAGAEVGVRALLDQELLGVVGQLQLQAVVVRRLVTLLQLELDDVLEVLAPAGGRRSRRPGGR
jgi:hypothetical protein